MSEMWVTPCIYCEYEIRGSFENLMKSESRMRTHMRECFDVWHNQVINEWVSHRVDGLENE